ncbi:hypothetical protein J6590_002863 [Homalodisca vitripennis]|nr:hypothetical protein J6590_002863 [Homalodisca vitripennis]
MAIPMVSSLSKNWNHMKRMGTRLRRLKSENTRIILSKKLEINIGKFTVLSMKQMDQHRIKASERNSSDFKKQARQKKRQVTRKLEDKEEDPDDPSYGAGLF